MTLRSFLKKKKKESLSYDRKTVLMGGQGRIRGSPREKGESSTNLRRVRTSDLCRNRKVPRKGDLQSNPTVSQGPPTPVRAPTVKVSPTMGLYSPCDCQWIVQFQS